MPFLRDIDGKTPEQMKAIEGFYQFPYGFFLMAGTNGTGKSFTAEVIYQKHSSFRLPQYDHDESWFITQADLNEIWLQSKGETFELSQGLKKTKLLVLDDLGTRMPSSAFLDFLYALLDFRWRNRMTLGTIITTNMNSEKMREYFGDAIVSRVASDQVIRIDGLDRRFKSF